MDNKPPHFLPGDAEIIVSGLIAKLQDGTKIPFCPIFKKQIEKAIKDLHFLKLCFKVAEDHIAASSVDSTNDQRLNYKMTVQLLKAVYAVDDATDTLQLTSEASHEIRRQRSPQQRMQRPSITYLCSQYLFIREINKFKHAVRDFYQLLQKKEAATFDIRNTRLRSQSDHSGPQTQQQRRWERIYCCFKEETEIDLEKNIESLEKKVLATKSDDSLKPIVVFGEAGSGKTTLVRTFYNKLLRMRSFDRYAWVRVPRLFRASYVLADILKQINQTDLAVDATASEEELIGKLTEILKEGTFLIVIEDVEVPEFWDALQLNQVDCSRGKIIITTHKKVVAEHINDGAKTIEKVSKLNEVDSWNLLRKKVGEKLVSSLPEEQNQRLCAGLPLHIVLLGGLLSTKEPSDDEWLRVTEHADKLGKDIFALCYQDLPSQVKPCFLYMGLFPKGFEIPVRRLIHLWVSEGFVTVPLGSEMGTVPEDLAEMCFQELVIRNMIQVRWRLDGSPKTCCMPGALYDIFSPKAAEVGFFDNQFPSSKDSSTKQPRYAVRRLAACLGFKIFRSSFIQAQHLRTFVAFDTRISAGIPSGEIGMYLNKITNKQGFGLLKVLDLEGVYKPVISDALLKLLLLSYLSLRSTAIDSLPSSVGNLPCLETLDVKHTVLYDLPPSTWLAKKLRHLYLNWSCSSNFSSSKLRQAIEPVSTNLLTLWGLTVSSGSAVGFLQKFSGLRKLGVTCTSKSTAEATGKWICQLRELHSLKLRAIEQRKDQPEDVIYLELLHMQPLDKLEDLYLMGSLSKKSLMKDYFPPKLRMLTLCGSGLEDDPMPVLGELPDLHILRLFGKSFTGKKITCQDKGFPKLRVLKLWKLDSLEEWIVEKEAMPSLRELEIRSCKNLTLAPGLKYFPALKKLELSETPLDCQLQEVKAKIEIYNQ